MKSEIKWLRELVEMQTKAMVRMMESIEKADKIAIKDKQQSPKSTIKNN